MHKHTVFVRYLIALTIVVLLLPFVGCAAGDPITERVYFNEISVSSNTSITTRDGTTFGGGGVGVEVDPVYILSDAFHITAAEIATWNGHPALTTGTHGVTGTIVGTSDVQSLTNKNLTMNNNVPIYWKDTLGNSKEVFNLWLDNNLDILYNETADIFIWEGSGTGQRMFLWPTASTAISTAKDSPTLDFVANYWSGLNVNWEAKIIHNMITAGATPKSRLEFEIQGEDVLRLENDTGVVKAYFDGALDMTTHQINNVVDPTLAQDAATKNYVDTGISGNLTGYVPYTGATGNINLNAKEVTNGTLNAMVGKGTWTASGTWTLPAVTHNGFITAPTKGIISGAVDSYIQFRGGDASSAGWGAILQLGGANQGSLLGGLYVYTPNLAKDSNTTRLIIYGDTDRVVAKWTDTDQFITAGSLYMSQIVAEPSSTANRAGIYALDLSADNCTIGFFTEQAVEVALGHASTRRMPVRWNGATYYLLAEASGVGTPVVSTVEPTVEEGLQVGLVFFNTATNTWKKCTSIDPVTWETLSSGGATAWGSISGNITDQTDLQGALDSKLSAITGVELDNVFSSNGLLKRTGAGTYAVDDSVYLTSFTELDPAFGASVASSIQSSNITSWNNKLSSITGAELDNVFSEVGLLKRTGATTYTVDTSGYLTGNQNITLSGDLSGSGNTSISANVTGIQGKAISLATGFLRYSGSDWAFDSSTYVTSGVTTLSSLSSIGTITTGSWNGTVLAGQFGGTGVANTGKTVTLVGSLSTTGGTSTLSFALGGNTAVTLPTSGTLLTANQNITLSSDASGSGTTSIAVTNTGLKGVALPTLSTGYLYYNGSAWAFQTPAGGTHNLLDGSTHLDTTAGTVARGDIITGQGSTPKWMKLLKGTANQVLAMDATGTDVVWTTPVGGSNPSWYGKFYGTRGDCNPMTQALHENMLSVLGPTPTGIGITTGRCVQFTPPADILVTHVRLFGVGATTNLYKFAIYPVGTGSAKTWDSGTRTTAANTWLDITTGTPASFTLTAGTKYWWCVTTVATGTTAGFRSDAAPLGTNYWGAAAAPIGNSSQGLPVYAQFTVTSPGVFPATLPAVAAAAYSGGTTGSVPFSYLDYGGAK